MLRSCGEWPRIRQSSPRRPAARLGAGTRRRAAPALVRARRRGLRARGRLVSADPADGLAAARGRDAGAVRRPEVDSGPLRHGARPARRRASALPVRLDRRAHGRRSRRAAARLGDLRDGDVPVVALLGSRSSPAARRLSRRRCSARPAGCCSSTASTGACTACSCSRARSRSSRCCTRARSGRAVRGRCGRSRCCSASRPTRTARSCWRRRASTSCSRGCRSASSFPRSRPSSFSASRSGVPISCSPAASTSASATGRRRSAARRSIASYLEIVAGDFTAGYTPVITVVLLLALVGFLSLARRKPRGAVLVAAVVVVPLVALILAKLGSAAPDVAASDLHAPVLRARRRGRRDPGRFAGEALGAARRRSSACWRCSRPRSPGACTAHPSSTGARRAFTSSARAAASAYIASVARPDDVLFGYEPLYLQALDRGGRISKLVVPRADPTLALKTLQSARKPLGHGMWVFDASDTTNAEQKETIPLLSPYGPRTSTSRRSGRSSSSGRCSRPVVWPAISS